MDVLESIGIEVPRPFGDDHVLTVESVHSNPIKRAQSMASMKSDHPGTKAAMYKIAK